MEVRVNDAIKFAMMYANAAPGFEKEAFEVALQHYLNMRKDVTSKSTEKQQKVNTTHQSEIENTLHPMPDSSIHKSNFEQKSLIFAEKCNLSKNDLKDIFYIDNDQIHLLDVPSGTSAEKQGIVSQCILTAYHIFFDREWLDSSQLMRCVANSNVEGMDHFARNMRRRKNILIRGKGKGNTLEYRITGSGKLETFELIHDIIKGILK